MPSDAGSESPCALQRAARLAGTEGPCPQTRPSPRREWGPRRSALANVPSTRVCLPLAHPLASPGLGRSGDQRESPLFSKTQRNRVGHVAGTHARSWRGHPHVLVTWVPVRGTLEAAPLGSRDHSPCPRAPAAAAPPLGPRAGQPSQDRACPVLSVTVVGGGSLPTDHASPASPVF